VGEFTVELDGKKVADFRADGVIVSTPTARPPTRGRQRPIPRPMSNA